MEDAIWNLQVIYGSKCNLRTEMLTILNIHVLLQFGHWKRCVLESRSWGAPSFVCVNISGLQLASGNASACAVEGHGILVFTVISPTCLLEVANQLFLKPSIPWLFSYSSVLRSWRYDARELRDPIKHLPICVLHQMVMVLISSLSEVWVPPPNGRRQCMGASIPGAQVQCTMEDYSKFLEWKRWCCLFLGCFLPLFLWLGLQICTNTSPPVWASAATQNSKMCFWVMGWISRVYNQQHDDSKEEEEWCKLIVLDSDGGKWWRGNATDCKWGHEIFLVYLATPKRRI